MRPPPRFPFSLLPLLSGFRQFLFFLCFLFPPQFSPLVPAFCRFQPLSVISRARFPFPFPFPVLPLSHSPLVSLFRLLSFRFHFSISPFFFPALSVPPFRFLSSCFTLSALSLPDFPFPRTRLPFPLLRHPCFPFSASSRPLLLPRFRRAPASKGEPVKKSIFFR